jgi:hypothetical protein
MSFTPLVSLGTNSFNLNVDSAAIKSFFKSQERNENGGEVSDTSII